MHSAREDPINPDYRVRRCLDICRVRTNGLHAHHFHESVGVAAVVLVGGDVANTGVNESRAAEQAEKRERLQGLR